VIHPTAIIHPKAKVETTVRVGPYAVIDEGVELGGGCVVGPHVYLTGRTIVGPNNHFYAGCVIGEAPQDLRYAGEPTGLRIGERNVFREHVTVNRSSTPGEETMVGSGNFFMAAAHVAHNCRVGNSVILANGALLGGYVSVDDRAFLSASSMVHQFCRVGAVALTQGGTVLTQDLPPFTIGRRVNELCGLNVVGLRRAGFTSEERLELKQIYHAVFRAGTKLREAVAEAKKRFPSKTARVLFEFLENTKRGICGDTGPGDEPETAQELG